MTPEAPKTSRAGNWLLVILVLLGGALAYGVSRQVARRSLYTAEGRARGNLSMLRSALSIYAKDHGGKYPQDVKVLATNREYLLEIPVLWAGLNSFSHVHVPHEPSAEFVYYITRTLADSGKWALVSDERDKDYGTVYIDCTHKAQTDRSGARWSSY